MLPEIQLADCWAKTDPETGRPALTVRDHCLIVGSVAEQLRRILPTVFDDILPSGAVSLAAVHDIGKLTAGFECKCEHWKEWARKRGINANRLQNSCRNHAAVSQDDITSRLAPGATAWALALGGHHGRFLRSNPVPEHSASKRLFAPLRDQLTAEILKRFGPLPSDAPSGASDQSEYPFIAALCGFVILCDWLGSDEENFPLPPAFPPSGPINYGALNERARTALHRRALDQPGLQTNPGFAVLFTPEGQHPYSPNPLQETCLKHINGPGLYLVEAPMGMGKTEAALYAAADLVAREKAAGIYFALPTQLTSNKIHERVAAFLARAIETNNHTEATLALAHAASWLKDSTDFRIRSSKSDADDDATDPQTVRTWFTSRRALLARYGVGTIDQALMGTLPVKFAALRLFGLAGKVVILDEVHTYDAYTSCLIDRLVADLLALRCTIVILSATLTNARRSALSAIANPEEPAQPLPDAYPQLTCCRPGSPVETLPIAHPGDLPAHKVAIRRISLPKPARPDSPNSPDAILPESLVEEIHSRAKGGECVLIIRNTVALAQQTFSRLQQEGIETGLIHSRFPFHVRNGHPIDEFRNPEFPEGREDAWADRLGKPGPRPNGCILVATQVAEQSLDIDSDLLVTDLCPIDMLLQRMGRLWRHMTLRPAASRPCPKPATWVLVPPMPPDADADELDHALKPHSAIYAPYILLRTLEILEASEAIQLPENIRPLLEAVHSPRPESSDPPAWAELRHRMEEKIESLKSRAGFLNDRYLPPQSDDEFAAPTRYSDYPTSDLVLLHSQPKALPGGAFELHFHSGETLTWTPGQPWNFKIARAVFLSTARVARHQIPKHIQKQTQPEWLALHARGSAAAAAIATDGTLAATDSEAPLPFRYEPKRGLIFDTALAADETPQSQNECPY